MKSQKKTILIACAVGLLTGTLSLLTAPKVSESCRDFREKMQQLAFNDSGLAGIIAVMPEDVMERALADRYGSMTPEQCTKSAEPLSAEIRALGQTSWSGKMQQADADVKQAMKVCHDKRMNGELKSNVESAQCSNPLIIAAFDRAGYPHKDLVSKFTDLRMELAKKLDKDDPGGSMKDSDFSQISLEIAEEEGKRASEVKK